MVERFHAGGRPMRRRHAPSVAVVYGGFGRRRPFKSKRIRASSGSASWAMAASRSSSSSVEPPSPELETRTSCGERRSSIVGAMLPSTTSRATRQASSTNASETLRADAAVEIRRGDTPSGPVRELDSLLAIRTADRGAASLFERPRGGRPNPLRRFSKVGNVQNLLRFPEEVRGADPPAAQAAAKDALSALAAKP